MKKCSKLDSVGFDCCKCSKEKMTKFFLKYGGQLNLYLSYCLSKKLSSDPFYVVTYYKKGSLLIGHIVVYLLYPSHYAPL